MLMNMARPPGRGTCPRWDAAYYRKKVNGISVKQILHIFGASGSGTSTLGRHFCEETGYRFMDADDYLWLPTDPRFTTLREPAERVKLIERDFGAADNAVLSGSVTKWGDALIPLFTLAVRLVTDTETRLARIREREYARFGERIRPGGDMYQTHRAFLAWAAKYDEGDLSMRSKRAHDAWQQLLPCPVIVLSGSDSPADNTARIMEELKKL